MRRTAVVILLAAAILGAAGGAVWTHRPRPIYGPHFVNRSVAAEPGRMRLLFTEAPPPDVINGHDKFSENVLLIRSTDVVGSAAFLSPVPADASDGAWSFVNVLARAAKTTDPAAIQTMMDQWRQILESGTYSILAMKTFEASWRQLDANYAVDKAPVRLLAVVNRIDEARVQNDGTVCGAEIRFDYAALVDKPRDHFLSLIVEFVLPCVPKVLSPPPADPQKRISFQDLANDWSALNVQPDRTTYLQSLESLLDKWIATAVRARLRLIANNSSDGWDPREFVFGAAQSGVCGADSGRLEIQPLERQPNTHNAQSGICQTAGKPLANFAQQNTDPILLSQHEFTGNLATCGGSESITGATKVIGLSPDLQLSAPVDDVRFALSINACKACHSLESGTVAPFTHIAPADAGMPANRSGFLTGSADCSADQPICGANGCVATYCTPKNLQDACSSMPPARQFNDLLRRHLYLYTVGQLRTSDDWAAQLSPFAAYQSH